MISAISKTSNTKDKAQAIRLASDKWRVNSLSINTYHLIELEIKAIYIEKRDIGKGIVLSLKL